MIRYRQPQKSAKIPKLVKSSTSSNKFSRCWSLLLSWIILMNKISSRAVESLNGLPYFIKLFKNSTMPILREENGL